MTALCLKTERAEDSMRKYWIIGGSVVGGLVVLAALAVLVIPNLIPQEVYRAEIEKVAYQVTGRKVTVTGRIDVAVFPRIEARAGASTIANPEGFAGTDFASMKELRAAVALRATGFVRVPKRLPAEQLTHWDAW
jgi:AsmA protein